MDITELLPLYYPDYNIIIIINIIRLYFVVYDILRVSMYTKSKQIYDAHK